MERLLFATKHFIHEATHPRQWCSWLAISGGLLLLSFSVRYQQKALICYQERQCPFGLGVTYLVAASGYTKVTQPAMHAT